MTHDELRSTIKDLFDKGFDAEIKNAMLAVVELHKPMKNPNKGFEINDVCDSCSLQSSWWISYPCPTIKAIEKKFK